MSKFAKALYDNTAECADELAFKRGDILTVMEQNVVNTSGWWMCSLHGRHGLAPANRLELLPRTVIAAGHLRHDAEKNPFNKAKSHVKVQNIYQTPSAPRPISTPAYERMDMFYKASSSPSQILSASRQQTDGPDLNKPSFSNFASSPKGGVYDVPSQARRASLFVESSPSSQMPEKKSVASVSDLKNTSDTPENLKSNNQRDSYVYAVPPSLAQDPNYDIPVPLAREYQHRNPSGFSTLPNPSKHEWIYDVPAGSEKQSITQGNYGTLPSRTVDRHMYDSTPVQKAVPDTSIYDTPKSCTADKPSPSKLFTQTQLSNKPPTQQTTEEIPCAVPPKEGPDPQVVNDPLGDYKPIEIRGDSNNTLELKTVRLQRMRNFLACTSFHDLSGNRNVLVAKEDQFKPGLSPGVNQRISTASSSSTSSCDSLALSSSSPEPLREVILSQEEACRKLLELQESVCAAIPQLMDFVSSNWRSKDHLEKHLNKIKEATEKIVSTLTCFLNFALDVKGNARHLTDTNLQTRLYKQLSIVEDSGVILQQTASSVNMAGWTLNKLCQEEGQIQNPDQLDRFVMVARTVPDDVKRLVSIIYGNSKLLFKSPQKEQEPLSSRSPPQTKKSPNKMEQGQESQEDDNDYVELEKKIEEKKPQEVHKDLKENISPTSKRAENKCNSSDSSSSTEEPQPVSLSEHCRLYFGALQKAIGGFVESLQSNHPPEKFISQSKLVIMVGQRLVDTLCREAHRRGSCQNLLCKSNHLCALLKQLAVATKKAAVHYPDKQALLEVQDFAKELAQRAQQFRISLEL